MARGITESDVHKAADEIVAVGERPTVERIRLHLGTGSPNTVTKWLETWWRGLGDRLGGPRDHLAVPNAPEAVTALAGDWWVLALEHARDQTQRALTADRIALQEEQEAIHREREDFASQAERLSKKVEEAGQAERLAATQATELQRLVSQLETQLEAVTWQRDTAVTRADEAETARDAIGARIQALQDSTRAERAGLALHVKSVEDRAHSEIDRARQETRELRNHLAAQGKEHSAIEKALRGAAEQARAAASEAIREASVQRARADTLEKQMAKLRDLPKALAAAVRSKLHPKQRKPTQKAQSRPSKRASVRAATKLP